MLFLVAIILGLLLVGVAPIWPYSAHWGFTASRLLGPAFVIVLCAAFFMRSRMFPIKRKKAWSKKYKISVISAGTVIAVMLVFGALTLLGDDPASQIGYALHGFNATR